MAQGARPDQPFGGGGCLTLMIQGQPLERRPGMERRRGKQRIGWSRNDKPIT